MSFYSRLDDLETKFFVSKLSKFYSNTVEINSVKRKKPQRIVKSSGNQGSSVLFYFSKNTERFYAEE